MKALFLFLLGFFVWMSAPAQKVYFIYLQSENSVPFYVKLGDKVHSSTSAGYVILSNLVDSTYQFSIGFPGNNQEARFRISNNNNDRGYLIRNNQGSLQLFDLQSANVHRSVSDNAPGTGGTAYRIKDDAFTRLLAKAMNDSSLLLVEVPVQKEAVVQTKSEPAKPAVKEPVKTGEVQPVVLAEADKSDKKEKKASDIVKNDATAKEEIKKAEAEVKTEELKTDVVKTEPTAAEKENTGNQSTAGKNESKETQKTAIREEKKESSLEEKKEEVYKPSVVTKRSESSTTEGLGFVYLDEQNGVTDTIRIMIPPAKTAFRNESRKEKRKEKKSFLDLTNLDTTAQEKAVVTEVPVRKPCSVTATDNDFLKLRKNMAAKESEDAMLAEARRAWKNKCLTTEQVRNLSSLFLTAYGKFQFFESAYLHVSDSDQYPTLRTELKDEYYIKRFNTLIGQ